ncbi:MAG TPA: efflux RND transporter periplasmic adaptor subunit [Bryobacteraceae bacterium]|nr:efflux RND transporter periplasmic adaptor subunit [Bryobacteraceae bacterium]
MRQTPRLDGSNPGMPLSTRSRVLPAAAAIPLILLVCCASCGDSRPVSASGEREPTPEPELFSVPSAQISHLQIVPVRKSTWRTLVHTTGTVDWDADHTTQAITQVSGPITRILVDQGARVQKGDPLLYVASPDVANAVSAYRKAQNQRELAQRTLQRTRQLFEHGAAAAKDVETAEATLNDAATDVQNSLQALKIFNITQAQIDEAARQGVPINPELPVRAPISGTVVQKLVMPGQLIQAGATTCFMISDTRTVWVQAHIFDRDLPSVHVGDAVLETNASFPERFTGTVQYIGAMLDPDTRTTPVRIVTRNPGLLLKKDMFVDAVVHTRTQQDVLSVPVAAVLRDPQNQPFVYYEVQPQKFAQRTITTGAEQEGEVQVLSGLREGERVVADGSIFLQFANSQ